MSAAALSKLQIPQDWLQAMPYLADLRERMPLSIDDWHQVCDWLAGTKFDEQSGLAAEVAAALIRDFAPQSIREEAVQRLDRADLPNRLQSLRDVVQSDYGR